MDVFNMTYVKNTTVSKLKKKTLNHPVFKPIKVPTWSVPLNHPVCEDKSDTKRKVVIVSGTLIRNFVIRTTFDKFWYT